MSHGLAQFTPQQLLDAGRRSEADARPDLAYRFYRHLVDNYGYTAEAIEARGGLARVGAPAEPPPVWQAEAQPPPPPLPHVPGGARPSNARRPRARQPEAPSVHYRSGRVLAALATAIGWLTIIAASTAAVVASGAHLAQLPLPRGLKPTADLFLALAWALPAGAAMVLAGQVARALFDHATAARELVVIERARRLPE